MSAARTWVPPGPVACPECQEISGVPIVYGMPGPDLVALAKEGRISFGGCVIIEQPPCWRCRSCNVEWRDAISIDGPEDQPR